jgi:diaminopimelate epimerase
LSGQAAVVPFVKATACGNDFLLVESSVLTDSNRAAEISTLTRRLCDRHEGVGADGVEWMSANASADVAVRLINADGSEAEISGNGTRCVAAYVCAEQGKDQVGILTGAGLKTCTLIARRQSEYEFEIGMGRAEVEKDFAVTTNSGEVRGVPVSMGNPHFVVFVSEFPEKWRDLASEIQENRYFNHGINVEFVVVDNMNDIGVRFFERGVGETRSSGTGSCASAVAAIGAGRAKSPVRVHTRGGIQTVRVEGGTQLWLQGSARLVCRGEFYL